MLVKWNNILLHIKNEKKNAGRPRGGIEGIATTLHSLSSTFSYLLVSSLKKAN